MPRLGANLTFTGFAGTCDFSSVANAMYGNLTLGSGMTISGTQTLTLSGRGSQTLTSAGKGLTQSLTIDAAAGTYTLQDALTLSGLATAGVLTHISGTFATGGVAVTVASYLRTTGSTAQITLGTSTVTFTDTNGIFVWDCDSSTNVSAASATFVIGTSSVNARFFSGRGASYGALIYTVLGSTGTLQIAGGATFATFTIAGGRTLQMLIGGNPLIVTGQFIVQAQAGNILTINSSTGGSAQPITLPVGTRVDYCSIQDSTATGAPYAVNSTNVSGNTGWSFINADSLRYQRASHGS
jgi:hypothetical protein